MNLSHLNPKTILFSYQQAKEYIDSIIQNNGKEVVITLNTEMFVDSMEDFEFRDIINNSAVVLESNGICYLFSKKNGIKVNPLNGIDLAEKLIAEGYKVFILGSKQENVEAAVKNLKQRYIKANIVGYHNGYFDQSEQVIDYINKVEPQVLLVGMGSPKQEKWIYRNLDELRFNIGIGIGGSIDVWSGFVKRAPDIFRRSNLEWAYRIFTDFKRLPRLKKLLKFAMMTATGRI
ncbi:MAG: WecB/TagA/CpsF family glycosyltransferase [Candidatus Calescibacterium sp.]|nr:WecB/TagA/CpsF family glycosyltransferase [Candidatus Calescibacterium sp.]MCX7972163.1 WecB/TagA/CpsF family glycosyltransferase [bacterium]MDW8194852.1 WecB/TagA/CpsF family glycosyltransferase [Candidatus Calescibacterium sp.]